MMETPSISFQEQDGEGYDDETGPMEDASDLAQELFIRSEDSSDESPPTPGSIMSEGDIRMLLEEPKQEVEPFAPVDAQSESTEYTTNGEASPLPAPSPPAIPRLSRAFSTPTSSQLGHLVNPHRLSPSTPASLLSPPILGTIPDAQHFQEISLELADSVQMVIQTLLQLSPPQLLDPAKEQYAACSLSIPSPAISAMLTTMKNLNYMSANMSSLASKFKERTQALSGSDSPQALDEFDVGEMLQSVGDALSGLAAQAGVELVLFHADVGMKHVGVKGDECGISYTLSHVIRQVIETASPGDTLEIGLYITPLDQISEASRASSEAADTRPSSPTSISTSSLEYEGTLLVVFDVAHKYGQLEFDTSAEVNGDETETEFQANVSPMVVTIDRPAPVFDSGILQQLLRRVRGSLKTELRPRLFPIGRSCELSVILEPCSPDTFKESLPEEEVAFRSSFPLNVKLASEPSLEELMKFAESLEGKRVALYASSKGSFAHHLTSYLTAWQVDVSHMSGKSAPVQDAFPPSVAGVSISTSAVLTTAYPAAAEPSLNTIPEHGGEPAELASTLQIPQSPEFVVIDDDVAALRQRLLQWRAESPYTLNVHSRNRPSLAANHRPRSSPHIQRARGMNIGPLPGLSTPPVIVHFTSLSNYKLVKDAMQSYLATANLAPNAIPEVIVVPKPAGPRRFLTALRTAVIKPIVDPFFFPTATSPMSPSVHGLAQYSAFFSNNAPSNASSTSPETRPAVSPRTNSDLSIRLAREPIGDTATVVASSPLAKLDSPEYFTNTAVKMGESPAAGWLIQSPDGQPSGILFHPPEDRIRRHRPSPQQSLSDKRRKRELREVFPVMPPTPGLYSQDELDSLNALRSPREWIKLSQRRIYPSDPTIPLPADLRHTLSRHKSNLSTTSTSAEEEEGFDAPELNNDNQLQTRSRSSSVTSMRDELMAPNHSPIRSHISPRLDAAIPTNPLLPPELHEPQMIANAPIDKVHALSVLTRGYSGNHSINPLSPQRAPTLSGTPNPRRLTGESIKSGGSSVKKTETNIVPPIKVLIVEDNPINQTILSTFMRRKKIKYDVAKNGEEAVAKWRKGNFHLILMDIQMPVMDGIAATKEIRRQEKIDQSAAFPQTPSPGLTPSDKNKNPMDNKNLTSSPSNNTGTGSATATPYKASVIIVALTASSLQSDRVNALAAGCNDFLTKPVSLEWLNNKIIEWGSLKALQMWSDLRPEVIKSLSQQQAAHAKNVANKLQMPQSRRTGSTSTLRRRLPNAP